MTSPRRTVVLFAALALFAAPPPPGSAQEAGNLRLRILQQKLRENLSEIARSFEGTAGIQVVDLSSGGVFGVHEDVVFPQGSAIKIPVLLELFRRAGDDPSLLGRRLRITAADQVGGSGVLKNLTDGGAELTLEDLAVLMITESDNTATNVLIDELGMEAVNRLMDGLGAPRTRLQRKMIRPEDSARGRENLSTPAEAAALMARIHRCELPLTPAGCRRVREILEIPKDGPVGAPIPAEVPVAFKPGGIEGVATAWALVGLPDRPYVLTVMTTYGGDGSDLVERASKAAWEYFRRLARSTEYGVRVPLEVIREGRRPPP